MDPDSQENIRAANTTVATFHAKLSDVVVTVVRCNDAPVYGSVISQWLRCCATNRKVAASIPAGVIGIFQ